MSRSRRRSASPSRPRAQPRKQFAKARPQFHTVLVARAGQNLGGVQRGAAAVAARAVQTCTCMQLRWPCVGAWPSSSLRRSAARRSTDARARSRPEATARIAKIGHGGRLRRPCPKRTGQLGVAARVQNWASARSKCAFAPRRYSPANQIALTQRCDGRRRPRQLGVLRLDVVEKALRQCARAARQSRRARCCRVHWP